MNCGTASIRSCSFRPRERDQVVDRPRGAVSLPERIRCVLTDRPGRGIGRELGFQ